MAIRIPLKYIHLHAPLFLGGRNFKEKINASPDVLITHYMEGNRDEIHIVHGSHWTYFPRIGNVAGASPYDPALADIDIAIKPKDEPVPAPFVPQGKIKAQVSAPNGIKF